MRMTNMLWAALCFCLALHLSLFSAGAFSQTDFTALKQMDREKAVKYKTLKAAHLQDAAGEVSPRVLFDDADDDGMPDSWETSNGLDSNNPGDAWLDPDTDEVVNLFEYQLGSNPQGQSTPVKVTVPGNYGTLTEAIDGVAPGTCIRMAGGSYDVNYTTFSPKVVMIQGGWSQDFTSRDLKNFPTTLDGQLQEEILYFSISSGETAVIFDGLHFINGKGSFGAVGLIAEGSTFMKTSVYNCTFTRNDNEYDDEGVFEMFNWEESRSDRTFANTIVAGNSVSGLYGHVTGSTTAHWRLINTTISSNHNAGDSGHGIDVFTLDQGALTIHCYNSIIWGNDEDELEFWWNITFDADHSDIDDDLSFGGGAVYSPGDGMIDTDPLFVDAENADFHLDSSSPCIDKGINGGIPAIDFEGEARIEGAKVDLGADERSSGGCLGTRGDPSGDGNVNVLDMLSIANHILGNTILEDDAACRADCNGDGKINILDAINIANIILGIITACPGACQ